MPPADSRRGAAAGRPAPAPPPSALYDSRKECGAELLLRALRGFGGAPQPAGLLAERAGIGAGDVAGLAGELRALGYDVRGGGADGRLPYRLAPGPAPLALPWEIAGGGDYAGAPPPLRAARLGSHAVFFGTAGSTQERALSMARECAGSADGLVVVAGAQTAGRGRMGRRWVSPPGGLWMSVVAEPGPPAGAATLVPLAAALALAGAVRDAAGARADLKWPNDLLVGGRKAAGILVDASAGGPGGLDLVVVGIGVNLAVDAAEIDAEAGAPRGHGGAASLAAPGNGGAGARPDPALLARSFLERLEGELDGLARGGSAGVARRWEARSSMIGGEVEAELGGRTVRGTAAGLDSDGALLVNTGSATERIVAGDVVSVRRAQPGGT